MDSIIALCDYKNIFGTRYIAKPYRSGMDKVLLKETFSNLGFDLVFKKFSDVNFREDIFLNNYFIYTSSEDNDYHYKSYIEDIVFGIETNGAIPIPGFPFLRANNNKVFMEILREKYLKDITTAITSRHFGVLEELLYRKEDIVLPFVIKRAEGAMSKNVELVGNKSEIESRTKKISNSYSLSSYLKEIVRTYIHKGYLKESQYRRKFIIQNFIPNLTYDWKVLVFDNKFYVLKRSTRKDDFRSSGSGIRAYDYEPPTELLDFAEQITKSFNVPTISIDIAFDGTTYYMFEVQFVYFGTFTIDYSDIYFKRVNNKWEPIKEKSVLEVEYASSIASFIRNNYK